MNSTLELAQSSDISIYPNPFHHSLQIEMPSEENTSTMISIITVTGEKVLEQSLNFECKFTPKWVVYANNSNGKSDLQF